MCKNSSYLIFSPKTLWSLDRQYCKADVERIFPRRKTPIYFIVWNATWFMALYYSTNKQHNFKWDVWRIEVQALKEIKPFVIYILCYGLNETRISLLSILMGKLHSVKNPLIIDWLLETLLWHHQQVVTHLAFKSHYYYSKFLNLIFVYLFI